MKRKNVVKINLSQGQRSALWASLELLHCVSGPDAPQFDSRLIDMICDAFDSLDDNPEIATFSFSAAQHRLCCYALKYALLYLGSDFSYFSSPVPEQTNSALKEFTPEIQELHNLFSV